jgi:hypothetical protein
MWKWVYLIILLSASAYVLARGSKEERTILATLISAFFLTYLLYAQENRDWLIGHWSITIVDTLAFLILFYIALRSKRFWPLPIAALQFLPILTPLVALLGKNIVSYALGMTQGFWGYLQLLILVIASRRHQTRLAKLTKK